MKFGDIIENGWASDSNPIKRGVFVKRVKKGLQLTDMKGKFWVFCNSPDSDGNVKCKIIGSVLHENSSYFA